MDDFKIVFLANINKASTTTPPIVLMSLAAYLRQSGFTVDMIDIKSFKGDDFVFKEIVNEIKVKQPSIICLTCKVYEVLEVRFMVRKLKDLFPKIIFVLEGLYPSLCPDEFLYENTGFDFVCIGESELILRDLCKFSIEKRDLKFVRGIAFFQNSKIIKTEPNDYLKSLDSLPFLAYDLVDMNFYTQPSVLNFRGVPLVSFVLLTMRGCPFNCEFCIERKGAYKNVRLMSFKRVVDEIEFLVKNFHIDGLNFYDDIFTLDKLRLLNFCKELRSRKIKILWECSSRVTFITEETAREMAKAGCYQISFGVESGSQRILDLLKKEIKVEQVKPAFDLCKKYKIRQFANFMVNLPTETDEDLVKTINLARLLKANLVVFNVAMPVPGTEIYNTYRHKLNYSIKDYIYFNHHKSYSEFLKFTQEKARLSEYSETFVDLLSRLWVEFPGKKDMSIKFKLSYLKGTFRALSFLYNLNYLKLILRSRHKIRYLTSLVSWGFDRLRKR